MPDQYQLQMIEPLVWRSITKKTENHKNNVETNQKGNKKRPTTTMENSCDRRSVDHLPWTEWKDTDKRERLKNLEDREEHLESTLLKGNQTITTRFK